MGTRDNLTKALANGSREFVIYLLLTAQLITTKVSSEDYEELIKIASDVLEGKSDAKPEIQFTPNVGDKFTVVDEDLFDEVAHPMGHSDFFRTGCSFKLLSSPRYDLPHFRGQPLDFPGIACTFSESEIKKAFKIGVIKYFVEPTSQVPFDETLLKKGFKFIITDSDRWKKEVGNCKWGMQSQEVYIDQEYPYFNNETLSIKGIDVSNGVEECFWYNKNLVVEAFRNGIASYGQEPTVKTIVIDDIKYLLTPILRK